MYEFAFLRNAIVAKVALRSSRPIRTGHKYESWLGISLTAVMLLVVVSGFAVRYLLTYANQEVKDKLLLLQTARGDLDHAWGVLENTPVERRGLPNASLLTAGLASVGIDVSSGGPAGEVTRLAESSLSGDFDSPDWRPSLAPLVIQVTPLVSESFAATVIRQRQSILSRSPRTSAQPPHPKPANSRFSFQGLNNELEV